MSEMPGGAIPPRRPGEGTVDYVNRIAGGARAGGSASAPPPPAPDVPLGSPGLSGALQTNPPTPEQSPFGGGSALGLGQGYRRPDPGVYPYATDVYTPDLGGIGAADLTGSNAFTRSTSQALADYNRIRNQLTRAGKKKKRRN